MAGVACKSGPDGGGVDAAADSAASDGGDGGDAAGSTAVTFRLRNQTGEPVYVQANVFWQVLNGFQRLRAMNTCEYCDCEDQSCAVCGLALPQTIMIAPGEVYTWDWAGVTWELHPYPRLAGIQCEQATAVPAGPLRILVEYSSVTMVSENPPGMVIGPKKEAATTFLHPSTREVMLVTDL